MTENIGFLYIVQMQISGSFDFKGHKNLNQQKIFNSRDGFFRKSPVCTFSCINPGFVWPWDMFLSKWHFWTCAWNSKIFLAKSILLKHYENGNKKNFPLHVPGFAKSRIYAGKSTKRGFSKKGLARIEKLFLF